MYHIFHHPPFFIILLSMATSFIEDMKRDTHALKMEPETNSNFLSSLLALNELDQQRVVAVINELFIAGIDSVSILAT